MIRLAWAFRVASPLWFAGSSVFAAFPLGAQQLTYTGSIQLANGDYVFTERSTSLYFANGLTLVSGRLRASVSLPIVAQSAGWVQYTGGGIVPSGGMHRDSSASPGAGMRNGMMSPQSEASHGAMGVGDPIGRLELDVLRDGWGTPMIRLAVAAKAPIASLGTGFGTGAWDVGAGFSVARAIGGTFLFADAMYWSLGDAPGLKLRDILSYGAAIGRPLRGGRFSVLASVLGTTPIIADVPAPLQAGTGVSYLTSSGRSFSISALLGLTRSAPDVAIGLGWQVPLR
jgi:hypothetical protein